MPFGPGMTEPHGVCRHLERATFPLPFPLPRRHWLFQDGDQSYLCDWVAGLVVVAGINYSPSNSVASVGESQASRAYEADNCEGN